MTRLRVALAATLVCALALAPAARAVEVEGIEFPQQVVPAPGAAPLVLSGAGLRRFLFFDVYAVGLYLPALAPSAESAISSPGRKRVSIAMLRDVDAAQFVDALQKGLHANQDEAAMQALAPSVARFESIFTSLGVVKKGMRIAIDSVPDTGTVVAIDGTAREPIPDPAFYPALLRNWLGEHPVQADLKRALLGGR
jgi:chalcone isomerase-like protein